MTDHMINNSSFRALFQQSRYSRRNDESVGDPRSNRQELFAVAAVAVAIKYEARFAVHFLKRICGMEKLGGLGDYEVELQPHHHSDLVIKNHKRKRLFVLEFKFHSRLKDKQNPEKPAFSASPKGYGVLIANEPNYLAFKDRHFITVQKAQAFDPIKVLGINCRSLTWKQVDVPRGSMGALVDDVLDSLGDLGIPTLRFRHINNMKKAEHTVGAVDMHQICESVASDLSFRKRDYDWEIGRDTNASWYGLHLPKGLKALKKVESMAGEMSDPMGWFGYQTPVGGKPELAVWLYASSKANAAKMLKAVEKLLQKNPEIRIGPLNEGAVPIVVVANSVKDDRQWFEWMFEVLRQ